MRHAAVEAANELAETRASLLRDLEDRNRELESFSYAVSHDLRAPLRHIDGFSKILMAEHADALSADARRCLERVCEATRRMDELVTDLLKLSRVSRAQLAIEDVDISALVHKVEDTLRQREPLRSVEVRVDDGMKARGDARLLEIVLENLLGNAWKFTSRTAQARIDVGIERQDRDDAFVIRDNGAGFDMAHAQRLFTPFQRLHTDEQFHGTGIGLATVQRIVARHGGRIWATAAPNQGASFCFTLRGSEQAVEQPQ
jgi:light-regulated signal transduction histidine kinase (bacteriophytochrome)